MQEKIKNICDALMLEALEPAKIEAGRIVAEAVGRAEEIIQKAKIQSEQILFEAKDMAEKEREVFKASLSHAYKQSLETLRQEIEQKLFNETLSEELTKEMAHPNVIAGLVHAMINAIEKEGLAQDIAVMIPKCISVEEVNGYLLEKVLKKLKNGSVEIGEITGGAGAQVRMTSQKMTLEITDHAIEEILKSYLRKDFRKLLFRS